MNEVSPVFATACSVFQGIPSFIFALLLISNNANQVSPVFATTCSVFQGIPSFIFALLLISNNVNQVFFELGEEHCTTGSKRQRLAQSDMPWYGVRGTRALIDHTKSCSQTCDLLKLYGEDLPRSKFLIQTASGAPEGIQASQWEQILRGEPLNLDHFLSSIVCTAIDEDRKAHLGETQLTFSTSEAKRKVRTSSDWATAW